MKAISGQGHYSSGNRFVAPPLRHTLKIRREKNSPVSDSEPGSDFAFAGGSPLQAKQTISSGHSSAVEECEMESAHGAAIEPNGVAIEPNVAAIEEIQESLAGVGAILPAQQEVFDTFDESVRKEKILLDKGAYTRILPLEHSLAMAYISSCRQGGRMIYVSPQIAHLGFAMEAWLGKTDLRLQQVHEDDFERLVQAIQHSCSTGDKFNCYYRLYDSNRKVHWFHDEARMTCDESGVPMFASGVMLEITDKKEMEAELNEHRHSLERHVEMRISQLMKRMELLESCNATLSGKLTLAQRELAVLKQPPTASIEQANICDEQLDGISDWARNMICLRVAANM